MNENGVLRTWLIVAGAALVGAGLLGFVDNPIASGSENALFRVNGVHNAIHLATGLLALAIALGLRGRDQATAAVGFGVLYGAVAVVGIVDPSLFGLMSDAPINAGDHVLHLGAAVISVGLGWMARSGSGVTSASRA